MTITVQTTHDTQRIQQQFPALYNIGTREILMLTGPKGAIAQVEIYECGRYAHTYGSRPVFNAYQKMRGDF